MNIKNNIVILGAGESGLGAAILAIKQGATVFVSDKSPIKANYKNELQSLNIDFEEGVHSEEKILSADLIIKSPGIPDKAPLVVAAKEKGIPIISEIEYASRYTNAKIVAITGSNGKTTTTSLLYHICKKAGLNVGLGGNIGTSFARQVADNTFDLYVLELSSFQLDGCFDFCPNISILCNITEDHMDRYDYKIENYIRSKFRIAQKQTASDSFIYCVDDEISQQWLPKMNLKAQIFPISSNQVFQENAAWKEDQNLIFNHNHNQFEMQVHELALTGMHNTYNSMAAGMAAKLLGVRKEIIRESLQDFKSLEHRMEFVSTIRGIDFMNDSKATNVNSTWFALESISKPIIWIAGGVDKGNDYTQLKELVKNKVKAIVCLGKDNEKIHHAFSEDVGYILDTDNAEEAVAMAYNLAEKGELVLLSPACASFDLFENYEDRGRQFKRAVMAL